ncbi:MAG TPA: hypothetical protein VE569_00365 [Acidimicrobiia bacterium]|nr:hypothetical protein [Acidimicrobiia bacterium]
MRLRRLSGARTDQLVAAVADRAKSLAGRAADPSAAVEELLGLAEGRRFILETAYAVAARRHLGDEDTGFAVQLLQMATYALQHRRGAGARTRRLLSSINLLLHGSYLLLVLGLMLWLAWRGVAQRDALILIVAIPVGAFFTVRIAYIMWMLFSLPCPERSETSLPAVSASGTGGAKTIPELAADTLLTARRVAENDVPATDPIEDLARAARGGQTGPVAEYRAKLVLEEAYRRASFIPPISSVNRRVYHMLREAKQTVS